MCAVREQQKVVEKYRAHTMEGREGGAMQFTTGIHRRMRNKRISWTTISRRRSSMHNIQKARSEGEALCTYTFAHTLEPPYTSETYWVPYLKTV